MAWKNLVFLWDTRPGNGGNLVSHSASAWASISSVEAFKTSAINDRNWKKHGWWMRILPNYQNELMLGYNNTNYVLSNHESFWAAPKPWASNLGVNFIKWTRFCAGLKWVWKCCTFKSDYHHFLDFPGHMEIFPIFTPVLIAKMWVCMTPQSLTTAAVPVAEIPSRAFFLKSWKSPLADITRSFARHSFTSHIKIMRQFYDQAQDDNANVPHMR